MRLQPELGIPARDDHVPAGMRFMRVFGLALMVGYIASSILADPGPGLHGRGPFVALAIAVLVLGLAAAAQRDRLPTGVRLGALSAVLAASIGLIALQGDQSSAVAGIYFTSVLGALRLPKVQAAALVGAAVVGGSLAFLIAVPDAAGPVITIVTGVPPWFFVIRVMRQLRIRQAHALQMVQELQDSRAAQAAAVAEAERSRVARDMHDVLAHSLSALAIQLELARVLARRPGTDPELAATVARAHSLAGSGLDEARRAIGALRGDELPGPERLQALADAFGDHGAAHCAVQVHGEPRALGSETRLAIYRTAQEALTNIRKHAAPERVELVLAYDGEGTTLRVQDHGARTAVAVGAGNGAPVSRGNGAPGGGYGLTGMRERAELLGGRLEAGPTDDGFRVQLWLPA